MSTDYSPQNSIKLLFIKLYDFCLQPTSRQKSPLQIFSESPPKRNEILRFRKFQESFVKVSLSSKVLALQSRVSYFISKKTTFLFDIVGSVPGKGLNCSHFVKVIRLLSRVCKFLNKIKLHFFQKMFSKTTVFESVEDFPEKRLS